MKRIQSVVVVGVVSILSACGRVHDHSDLSRSVLASNGKQIAQVCLIYESTNGKSDADQTVTLSDLVPSQPSLFDEALLESIRKEEIVFIPQKLPIAPDSILVVVRYGSQIATISADLRTRVYDEKKK
jgi:hypothetical protein